jgi:hypothetical protein
MNPMNEDLRALGGLGESLNEIFSHLQLGGPEPRFELIVGYIDGVLEPAAMQQVGRNIVTWQAWYDAYWETLGALDEEDDSLVESDSMENPSLSFSGFEDDAQGYLNQDYINLVAQLPRYATAVRSDPLGPYRAALRTLVCERWKWLDRKKELAHATEVQITAALARELAGGSLDMPFPVTLVAAILVKEGLDGLCSEGEAL